jgi:RNA methyltransferase, TrmH family
VPNQGRRSFSPPGPRRDPPPNDAELVHGLRAGLAVFACRRDEILRIAYAADVQREARDLIRWAGGRGVSCSLATTSELDRFAESAHHEGLCLLTRPRRWAPAQEVGDALLRARGAAIALDRVRNPYNVGAVVRSAAFFGVDAVVLGAPSPHPGLAPIAVRVAEGGAEEVTMARTTDLADTLARLRSRGVRVYGADARAQDDALGFAFEGPAVIVVGNEREGLGDRVRAQCDRLVAIRGSGRVESLNVAVAAGLLMGGAMGAIGALRAATAPRHGPEVTGPEGRRTR